MYLLQSKWKMLVRIIRLGCSYVTVYALASCAIAVPAQQSEKSIAEALGKVVAVEQILGQKTEIENSPLTAELVYYILMAEIAGQRGEIGIAVDLYHKASIKIKSPALAGRSAQFAGFTRDRQRISRALDRWVEVDPAHASIFIMQESIWVLQDDYNIAIKAIDAALALGSQDARIFLALIAEQLTKLVGADRGLNFLQRLKQYRASDPDVLFVYGKLAAFYEQHVDALKAVDGVLKRQPQREDALVLKAEVLQLMGKGDFALSLLLKAILVKDVSDNLRFFYAKSLCKNGKMKQSRQIFEQLHDANPLDNNVVFALGLLALGDKDSGRVKKYFSLLIERGDRNKQAAYFMGLFEERNTRIEKALIWFASVPGGSSRYQSARTHYNNLLAERVDINEVRNHLKLLREKDPNRAVKYFLFEASFLREQGNFFTAFDVYTESLARFPNNKELLYGRAMVSQALNRMNTLEQDLRIILYKDPNNSQVLNTLGYTLTYYANRHQEALILIKKAVNLKPNDPFYLDSLGWVYYQLGNLDIAERYLRQAVGLHPDTEFLAHLGEILWLSGKKVEAKKMWQQGLQQSQNNELLLNTMRGFSL